MNNNSSCLRGENVTKIFWSGRKKTIAVNNVSFNFKRGEIVSIVGESGSGKTTLARMILGLLKPTDGKFYYNGAPRNISSQAARREYWKRVQAVFQDPFSTFNIFHKVDSLFLDCLKMKGENHLTQKEKQSRMKEACEFVNLKYEELYNKYPFELSGGQMQRVMIARIFMLKPKVLIADEPTSMIDACSRATILEMFLKLRKEENMTIVFITHDIGLAYYISDSVYIMEHGQFIEHGTADEVILHPKVAYTVRLISDVPKIHEPWDFSRTTAQPPKKKIPYSVND